MNHKIESIDINISLNNDQQPNVVNEIIKYLITFNNLGQQSFVATTNAGRISKSAQSKIDKFQKQCDRLFQSIQREFSKPSTEIAMVALIFGSSVISPREIYLIRFAQSSTITSLDMQDDQATTMREIFRSLVIAQPNSFIDQIPITKMFTLLFRKYNSNNSNNHDDNNNQEEIDEKDTDRFIPKQNQTSITFKKSTKITLFDFDSSTTPISDLIEINKNKILFKCNINNDDNNNNSDMEMDMEIDTSQTSDNNDINNYRESIICLQSPISIKGM
ncbi:hypothetical protein PPL_02775 [Heterostelium album PN500]|uniref:Uncharacterized protein n=1 Tax=Heterostelium pallidum (strain ATCC 26659 / Pp 5 / PN500) TaxID=670386 RepID=D3B310_HETP5|nr:hypothetical protein PPL_02775 [Heterostelium album PN500]EFA83708.1 hypothetical protein PPL_02775 [Heterostelium album PN500]|eukprot:XP_020435825.1 hypothetical protein PPL_02775 [Heterostelium album PN500]